MKCSDDLFCGRRCLCPKNYQEGTNRLVLEDPVPEEACCLLGSEDTFSLSDGELKPTSTLPVRHDLTIESCLQAAFGVVG